MREAVFTVSPKRQYRGILYPTTPATQGPEEIQGRETPVRTKWKKCREVPNADTFASHSGSSESNGNGNTQCIQGLAAQYVYLYESMIYLRREVTIWLAVANGCWYQGRCTLPILNCFTALSTAVHAEVISPHCYCWNQEKYSSWSLRGVNGSYRNAEFFSPHIIRLSFILFFSCLSPRTCVYPSPQLQSARWHMRDHNLTNCCHQIQGHFGNLVGVFGAIPLWQAAHYHVGITNGFHLIERGTCHLSGGHQAFLSKGNKNKRCLGCPTLAKLRRIPSVIAGLGFHGFCLAALVYLVFTREQSKKDLNNCQIPCLQVCTHLVNIIRLNPAVKADVQIVEHLNDLQGSTGGGNACEPHDVREKDSHLWQGEGKGEAEVCRQQRQSLWRVQGFGKFWAEQPKAQAAQRTSVAELNRYKPKLTRSGFELFSSLLLWQIKLCLSPKFIICISLNTWC